jgi:hypothetical protein
MLDNYWICSPLRTGQREISPNSTTNDGCSGHDIRCLFLWVDSYPGNFLCSGLAPMCKFGKYRTEDSMVLFVTYGSDSAFPRSDPCSEYFTSGWHWWGTISLCLNGWMDIHTVWSEIYNSSCGKESHILRLGSNWVRVHHLLRRLIMIFHLGEEF